ncbi:uncharacterized protein SCODWIG_03368 [Saccharomycodes ludwigii]|uniref:RING-type domain-containing protein n=1 Tax=Saccharomycodes ludwigii TaxID=36035 RepID=A0A376BAE6_9ASCO|nr:hypothetical protein SCDLUD_005269 [Saccharomycodes ludwigii]KAH3898923.1 hypothetical protein SCDLUD_005269 [Saccharomycodes ludwigii]SSD61607.1 uncharacterized protein SCODWIG_03368 [Saccharomycodes ludwigii]
MHDKETRLNKSPSGDTMNNHNNSTFKTGNTAVPKDKNNDENTSAITSVSYWTRKFQMSTFLNDLQNGISFSNAITRLQTMGALMEQIIQENIDLYEEDEEEKEMEGDIKVDTTNKIPTNISHEEEEKGKEIKENDTVSEKDVYKETAEYQHINSKKIQQEEVTDERSNSKIPAKMLLNEVIIPRDKELFIDSPLYKEMVTISEEEKLNHEVLRQKIFKIKDLEGLNQQTKAFMIQKLMMGRYTVNKTGREGDIDILYDDTNVVGDTSDDDKECSSNDNTFPSPPPPILTDKDTEPPLYSDPFGCQHYMRNCKLCCNQCKGWYMCRFCHDEQVQSHNMIRSKTKWIMCLFCHNVQHPDSANCNKCGQSFAVYFCDKCKLYDNDEDKDIYHCDKCKICRLGLGLGLDYFHCDTCKACMPIELQDDEDKDLDSDIEMDKTNTDTEYNSNQQKQTQDELETNLVSEHKLKKIEELKKKKQKLKIKQHKCIDGNTKSNCPICGEYMFTSTRPVMYMQPCSHSIHKHCFDEYTKHSYKCPVCQVSVIDMELQFKILDKEIEEQPLPKPYCYWRCVYKCNDCNARGTCNYHILGLKCGNCFSYNTVQLQLIKPNTATSNSAAAEERSGSNSSLGINNGTNTHNSNQTIILDENIARRNEFLLRQHFQKGNNSGSMFNFGGSNNNNNNSDSSMPVSNQPYDTNSISNNTKLDNYMNNYFRYDDDDDDDDNDELSLSDFAQNFKNFLTQQNYSQRFKDFVSSNTLTFTSYNYNNEAHKEKNESKDDTDTNTTSSLLSDLSTAFKLFLNQQNPVESEYEEESKD